MTWLEGEAAARIPLTEGSVLDLIWQHFGDVDAVYVAPHIPASKELAARRVHVAHLPPRERILALYETPRANGILTAVHEGFIITSERICWKNAFEPARSIVWQDLDADQLLLDDRRLFIDEAADEALVLVEPEVQLACADALHILALSSRVQARASMTEGLPDFDDGQSGLVQRFEPRAPQRSGVMSSGELPPTERNVYKRATPSSMPPPSSSMTIAPPATISLFAYASEAQELAPDCKCWHCHTPLYATSPQCAFCGSEPTASGWQRTG